MKLAIHQVGKSLRIGTDGRPMFEPTTVPGFYRIDFHQPGYPVFTAQNPLFPESLGNSRTSIVMAAVLEYLFDLS
jgi:hypothetical protein